MRYKKLVPFLLLFVLVASSGCVNQSPTEANLPPNKPGSPSPDDGATVASADVSLSWSGGDPDGDQVTYCIRFGTTCVPVPPVIEPNYYGTYYPLDPLEFGKKYYWQIKAKDEHGAETVGDIWEFTTTYLVYNPDFKSDLSYWAACVVSGTGFIQWSPAHDGSAYMYLETTTPGLWAIGDLSQPTKCALQPGEEIVITTWHRYTDDVESPCLVVFLGDSAVCSKNLVNKEGDNTIYWVADKYYPTGTSFALRAAILPPGAIQVDWKAVEVR